MEEEVKVKFDETDKRYAVLEKRFDDLKWYFGGAASLFTLGFSVLVLVLSGNFNAEKEGLRDFKMDIRADLGKLELPPDLDLLGVDRTSLSGQDVAANIAIDQNHAHWLRISHLLKNKGDSSSGPLFVKLYTNDPIRFEAVSSDEPKYKHEAYIASSRLDPPEIPGKFSIQWFHQFFLEGETPIKRGRYPALLKVYYGKGRVTQANITLV